MTIQSRESNQVACLYLYSLEGVLCCVLTSAGDGYRFMQTLNFPEIGEYLLELYGDGALSRYGFNAFLQEKKAGDLTWRDRKVDRNLDIWRFDPNVALDSRRRQGWR
jgi:hypothetical protein